jgi:hypothetical protein
VRLPIKHTQGPLFKQTLNGRHRQPNLDIFVKNQAAGILPWSQFYIS